MKIFSNIIVILVITLFLYAFISIYLKDVKKKKIANEIKSNGVTTTGSIEKIISRSGSNSGFINVTITFNYSTHTGEKFTNNKDAVIEATSIHKFQPGEKIEVTYSKNSPQTSSINIPHPLMHRRK